MSAEIKKAKKKKLIEIEIFQDNLQPKKKKKKQKGLSERPANKLINLLSTAEDHAVCKPRAQSN